MVKITTTKICPHLMMITHRRLVMEGKVEPTFECTTKIMMKTSYTPSPLLTQHNIIFFSIKEDELITKTIED
jgi:hypothetical protein